MTFLPASIYSLFWVRDEPGRLGGPDPEVQARIKAATAERIVDCWAMMESQLVSPGRYLLGDELSVLDLYVTVVSRWGPRRVRFYEAAPRMAEVVRWSKAGGCRSRSSRAGSGWRRGEPFGGRTPRGCNGFLARSRRA
jgi:glutathione S-transferase